MTPGILISMELNSYEIALLVQCLQYTSQKEEFTPEDQIMSNVLISKLKTLVGKSEKSHD